jgi:hypothetical protein
MLIEVLLIEVCCYRSELQRVWPYREIRIWATTLINGVSSFRYCC